MSKQEQCVHHWIIEAARGPLSPGQCQHCGEEREFTNFVSSMEFSVGSVSKSQQRRLKKFDLTKKAE